ncbi:MAG: hypothetical protein AAF724_10495 [Pseudomonadota bacterium]
MTAVAYAVSYIARASRELPSFSMAHWFLRLPLAAIIMQQGFSKFPLAADEAASYGLPLILWSSAAIGEFAAGAALIAGGAFRNWAGELITRAAGLAIAAIVAGVLMVAYWAPPLDILLYNQFHVLLLVGGIYFALRGNRA